MVITY